MTTTVTVIGLGGAALAGAVGLGLAGLALLSHNRGGGGRPHGYGYGHGHGHGGGGYGHGHGYHRRKRSTEEEAEARENVLELIRQEDTTGCGLRMVCELGSTDEEELSIEELSILSLVGPVVQPGEGVLPDTATTAYRLARTNGYFKGNCQELYPSCPLDGKSLVNSVMAYIP